MTELSLNILDIANNSIRANATVIQIEVRIHNHDDLLLIRITDNGDGISKESLTHVEDPFYTTRTTRRIGLGIPFFKQSALDCQGEFQLTSILGEQTTVTATYRLSHIDRMPLGDINSTIYALIIANKHLDVYYTYQVDDKEFSLDTRDLRSILGDIPFDSPMVSDYIKEYLRENQYDVDGGATY